MASNVLLANAGIPLTSTYSCTNTPDTTYGLNNLVGGNKTDIFRLATAASGDTTITYTPTAASTANFLYIARADLLKASGVGTITLKGNSSSNYATATTVTTISSFGAATLMGPQSEDYLTTFTTSASYAYWFVNFNAASASKCPCAKVFFGNYFDPGKDPTDKVVIRRKRPTSLRKRSLYTFDLSWEGLTYANTVIFANRYARNRRHNPLILFTTSYHGIFSSQKVILCRMVDFTFPPRATDFCDVTATFEEIL
jgi:hypothetical protein